METFIESNGCEFLVAHDLIPGEPEYGTPPTIEVTYVADIDGTQNLLKKLNSETMDDIERQLWIMLDKGR
jgi:hypothetical protein